ncbi:hypothetical protein BHE74_00051369 [Ensete ventricosum]|nr:hypothetical protein BHE74_00051369 [Ensete ventricosum]
MAPHRGRAKGDTAVFFAATLVLWGVSVAFEMTFNRRSELAPIVGGFFFFQAANWAVRFSLSRDPRFVNTAVSLLHSTVTTSSVIAFSLEVWEVGVKSWPKEASFLDYTLVHQDLGSQFMDIHRAVEILYNLVGRERWDVNAVSCHLFPLVIPCLSASLDLQAARFKEAPPRRSPEPRRWALRASARVIPSDNIAVLVVERRVQARRKRSNTAVTTTRGDDDGSSLHSSSTVPVMDVRFRQVGGSGGRGGEK